ncbi:MAG: T9SS type A sorting domain-containing protein [Calditrichaceae bacterium]|nr:T9SS type A sorting domain-containing protein [Calditrichia bacterium]NUQ41084.1 T9SS type A sorting domain-containing protein [Calditrichaceae bacterium]
MKRFFQKLPTFLFLFFGFLPFILSAQWSNDPLQNLAIADTVGEQVLPKIQPTSDGGCYISWFDSRDGNYSVYLQRLNSQGAAQWSPRGLLISGHPQQTWLVDYDLGVDANDNAVLVFSDIRNGGSSDLDVFAYKISPGGAFLWGADGIGLSDLAAPEFEPAPKVAITGEGHAVVAWLKSGAEDMVALQKISAAGQKLWGANGILLQGAAGESLAPCGVVPAGGDSAIALWKNTTGPFWAPVTHLYTQKFAPDGSPSWDPAGVLIYNLGRIPFFTEPGIYDDGQGGAFFTWEDRPSLSDFNVGVGHISAAGALVYPLNGIVVSTFTGRLHLNPTLTSLPQAGEAFVFWLEENINQSQYGIYGQKFSYQGDRLWSDEGKQFLGLGGNQISFIRSAGADTVLYVSYFQSSAPNAFDAAVKAFRINRNGDYIWPSTELSAASLGNKGRLSMIANTERRAFLVWSDERVDLGDIYAQNVNPDGSLGNPVTATGNLPALPPAAFDLKQNYPNPFNPSTTIEYRLPVQGFVVLKIFNVLGQEVHTLVSEQQNPGEHRLVFDGANLPGGVYFYRLWVSTSSGEAGTFSQTRKFLLLK